MIIKTLQVACDHDGCVASFEGDIGESRALVVIKQARALGWVASDGRQYCPQHRDDAEDDLARFRVLLDSGAESSGRTFSPAPADTQAARP